MGYWYWRNLKTNWTQDEAATNRFDLPDQGMLSGLRIAVQQKNAAYLCNGYDNPYPTQKINPRIMGNGNKEIIDLRGKELEAINFWDTGKMSQMILWTVSGQTITEEVFIPFGRYLGDMKMGLDLGKWSSGVQFEDTNTWSTTYVTDTYQKYTIDGLFRKNPEGNLFSEGYLSKKHIANEESTARTQHEVKLPTTNKLKQIYLFTEPDLTDVTTYLPSITPFSNISAVWLGIKTNEEYILDNMPTGQQAYQMHQQYGRVADVGGLSGGGATTMYIDTKIYERQETTFGTYNTNPRSFVEDAATNLERIIKGYSYDLATPTAALGQHYWHAKGICPHGIIPLLMQDPKSEQNEWLDAGQMADVSVACSEGTSGYGKWYIVLDELQKHPS